MKDVSIIIVNYNTCKLTQNCINSIFEKTNDVSFEIIVVDNNSTDASLQELAADSRIVFIEAHDNLGFGKANNLGVKYAKGKYLLFLNSDTFLLNNALKHFVSFYETYSNVLHLGAIGCVLLDGNFRRTHSMGPFPTMTKLLKMEWGNLIMRRFGKQMKHHDDFYLKYSDKDYFSVDYVTGADLFVSHEVIEKYGCFDSDFFLYYEETEMQFRWKKSGLQSYIVCGPQIVHLEGASQKRSPKKQFVILRSMMLYCRKTYKKPEYLLFRVLFLLCRLISLPKQGYSLNEYKEYIRILLGK